MLATQTLKLCWLFYKLCHSNTFLCKLGHFWLKLIFFLVVPAMARSNLELWQLFYQLRQCNVFLSKLGHFSLKWFFSRRASNGWTETLKLCQLFYQQSCCNMFLCKLGHFSLKMIIFLIVPAVAGLKPLNFGLLSIILPTAPLQRFLMRARPFSLKIIFSRHTCDGITQTLELCQLFYQLRHQNMFLSELVHFSHKMIFSQHTCDGMTRSLELWIIVNYSTNCTTAMHS